jgi:hypothetical protein
MPPAKPGSARIARLIHLALLGGTILFTGLVVVVLPHPPTLSQPALRYVPFALAAVLFAGSLFIRSRIPPLRPGTNEDDWWHANLTIGIMIWTLLEGPSLFAAVMFLISGNTLTLVVTAVGVALLVFTAPARLVES